jgi:glutamyl-tRNA reductase
MPRNVEPSARRLPNVELRALTELTGTSGLPADMVRAAEAIILDELGRFERWLDARQARAPASRWRAAAQEQVA